MVGPVGAADPEAVGWPAPSVDTTIGVESHQAAFSWLVTLAASNRRLAGRQRGWGGPGAPVLSTTAGPSCGPRPIW